ncbi:MAG: hypothetical protein WDM80_08465 [Limisphaerales bacterium]
MLLAIFSLLLAGVFLPDQTLSSNDGPLGRLVAQCHQLPSRFNGCWDDLNLLGFNTGAATPGITFGLQYLLKPILFSKFYALLSLIILGLGAWCFFVNLRLAPVACILGGLAAALNSSFFSVACWGVAAQTITAGMIFFALAALADDSSRWRWWRVILAGLAVGMGVIEGADVGAIYSLYVAAFIIYQAWTGTDTLFKKMVAGFGRVALVALCAALIAAPSIFSLVHNYVDGVVENRPAAQTKEARWDWATQWSLPIRETIGVTVPGLFGYRMDTPGGGNYWGDVGRDPAIDRYIENGKQGPPPTGFIRYSGGGFYAGVMVVMLAFWAFIQSLRWKNSSLNLSERKWLWFWSVVALVSVLFAFGRFAPFYRLPYSLPYFSTIRNPVKFIGPASFALVVIFAYGLDGFWRRYLQPTGPAITPRWPGLKVWWAKAGKFEKRWMYGCGLVLGITLLAWFKYDDNRQELIDYLQTVQFDQPQAAAIASYSFRQVGWFVLFFTLSIGFMVSVFSGVFTGTRARWAAMVLGLLLVVDLGWANLPWVVYWNYPQKYASNPVIDLLRDRPYEHRIAILPGSWPPNLDALNKIYRRVWLQQQLPYYNIQALDIASLSRMPDDLGTYLKTLNVAGFESLLRLWRLTNTRYILGPADALANLNEAVDQAGQTNQTFRIVQCFNLAPRPGVTATDPLEQLTAVPDDQGLFALFEFTAALPRARLYSQWQSNANNQAVLEQLSSPTFDLNQNVLVSGELQASSTPTNQNQNAGQVNFISYAPKNILLKSDAPTPTVLMLNDRFDPAWKVLVDGQLKPLLRCNFIMRGVYLTPGAHTVEFQFQSPAKFLNLSLALIILGLLILSVVIISSRRMAR